MWWVVMVEREESLRTYRKAPINPAYGVKVTKADDDHVVQLPEDECTVGGFQKPKRVCQFFSLLSFGEIGAGEVGWELISYHTQPTRTFIHFGSPLQLRK